MKNSIFTLTLSVVALASCSNPIEEMTDKAITEIRSGLLDPKSFELISTEVDTIRYTWKLEKQMEPLHNFADMWLEEAIKMNKEAEWEHTFGRSADLEIRFAREYLDSSKVYQEQIKNLMSHYETIYGTPNDSIIGYSVDVRYYATNRGGDKAMGENRYYVFNNGNTSLEDISPLAKL